jgi:diacylglycerol kinase family enzyme
MQLRLTAMTTGELLPHIPAIWKGRTPCASILDFSAEKVRLSFDRPMPFQIGGDAQGMRQKVTLGIDSRPVEMLDFKSHG